MTFPEGDTITIDSEAGQLLSGVGYQGALYVVDDHGAVVRWQERGTVQYWGSKEAIRHVIYGEGLPD